MMRFILEGLFRRWAIFFAFTTLVVATALENDASAQQTVLPSDQHLAILKECLLDVQKMQDLKINWTTTRTLRDLEKCAFSMGAELENADALNRWLGLNGFSVKPPRVVPESVMRIHGISAGGLRLSGGISKGDIPLRLGIIDRFLVHSLSLGILLDDSERPISVQATFTRK